MRMGFSVAGALIGACLLAAPASAAPLGGAVAAGVLGGLVLGTIIATEAQRNQGVEYCMRRYRSYDPGSMTYVGRDGLRHGCP